VKWGKRTVLILLSCVGIAGFFALVWLKEAEPEYQGKRLSKWLQIYGNPANTQDKELAAEAVRQIGTNAVPVLLK